MLVWKSYHIIHSDLQTKLVLRNIFCSNENFLCDKSDFSCFKNSCKAIKMFGRHFILILIVLLVKWKNFLPEDIFEKTLMLEFRTRKDFSRPLNLRNLLSNSKSTVNFLIFVFEAPWAFKNGSFELISIHVRPSFKRLIKNTKISAKFLANPDICGSILQFQWIFTTTQTTKIQKQNFHTIVLLTWHEQPQKTKEKAIFISHFNIGLLSFFTRFYDHRNKFYSFISWSHRY